VLIPLIALILWSGLLEKAREIPGKAGENPKHEIRCTKQYKNSNVEIFKSYCFGDLNFGFVSNLDIRYSIFDIQPVLILQ